MFKSPRFIITTSKGKFIRFSANRSINQPFPEPKLTKNALSQYKTLENLFAFLRKPLNIQYMLNYYWGFGVVFISLMLITIGLWSNLKKDFSDLPKSRLDVPDYTMTNFKTIRMDEHGYPKNQLTAKKMVHYPQANTALTAPYMVFYDKEGQPTWTMRAEKGEISPDGNQINLLGHTTLQRQTQNPQQQVQVISEDVLVQVDTEYAETTAPSTIISHNSKTYSTGMRVFMPTEQVELLSKVRGHYVLSP
jgi:lipopolysaccharide export system protein LptC